MVIYNYFTYSQWIYVLDIWFLWSWTISCTSMKFVEELKLAEFSFFVTKVSIYKLLTIAWFSSVSKVFLAKGNEYHILVGSTFDFDGCSSSKETDLQKNYSCNSFEKNPTDESKIKNDAQNQADLEQKASHLTVINCLPSFFGAFSISKNKCNFIKSDQTKMILVKSPSGLRFRATLMKIIFQWTSLFCMKSIEFILNVYNWDVISE